MSRSARAWAVGQSLKGAPKAVLVVLADHANDANRAWPSIPLIAQTTGRSERAVQYALTHLQEQGAIAIERSLGGRGHASHYILNPDWTCGTMAPPSTSSARPNGANTAPIGPVNGANPAPFEAINGAKIAPFEAINGAKIAPIEPDPPPINGAKTAPLEPVNGAILTLNGAKVAPEPKKEPKKGRKEVSERAPASRRPPARTPIAPDWKPDAEQESYATNQCLDPGPIAKRFALWHRRKGTLSADWPAEWEWWCDNETRRIADQPERRANHFAESFWDDMNRAASQPDDPDADGRRAIEAICGVTYGTA